MRLGASPFRAETAAELPVLCEKLDCHGLSAITAPKGLAEFSDDECASYGALARELNLVIGEAGYWENLLTPNAELQAQRIEKVRLLLRKAEVMGVRAVVTLVGTKDPGDSPLAPHPYLFTEACQAEFREVVLRILDGLDLQKTHYIIEPWTNTFFYQPEEIRQFIDRVGHPSFGLHLDQVNMISHPYFYNTTELINTTFDLLADWVWSVHVKDVRWDYKHLMLKWDETNIGDGVMDYQTYLRRIASLPADITCYCEHMREERDYALNFARLHYLAGKAGVSFIRR